MTIQAPTTRKAVGTWLDFHMHSTSSDGARRDTELVDSMCRHNVTVGAVTDHDSMAAGRNLALCNHLKKIGEAAPRIVPGVEISCSLHAPLAKGGKSSLHIVGLGCNPRHPGLRKALLRQRLGRHARIRACIEALQEQGYDIRYEELGTAVRGHAVYPWCISELLTKRGYAKTYKEAHRNIVKPNLPGPDEVEKPYLMDPAEAISLIKEAGGVAILAHPHRNIPTHEAQKIVDLMKDLQSKGIDAVEVHRQDLEPEYQPLYEAAADKVGLLKSGGSDFHERTYRGKNRHPGDAKAPAKLWPALRRLIEVRGGFTDVLELDFSAKPGASAAERFMLTRRG